MLTDLQYVLSSFFIEASESLSIHATTARKALVFAGGIEQAGVTLLLSYDTRA
jgi:hypothetical protein